MFDFQSQDWLVELLVWKTREVRATAPSHTRFNRDRRSWVERHEVVGRSVRSVVLGWRHRADILA